MAARPFAPVAAAGSWHCQASDLAQACAGAFVAEELARLDELCRLIADAPLYAPDGLLASAAAILARTVTPGEVVAVALGLIEAANGGYLLSCGAGGGHMASIVLPGATHEATMTADSAALALIGAVALALSQRDRPPLAIAGHSRRAGITIN